ncbi:MAG: hypothetical protein KF850_19225 [Labilithrix sp.]|nr:hypothetical protein [Labilithrix sp.]
MPRAIALRTCAAGLAAALALLAGERGALAEPSLDLTWDAPAGCPDREWVRAAVLHLVTSSSAQELHVHAAVRAEGDQWIVDLALSGAATGTRTLRASTCTSVARGAALIVALTLDPQAAASVPEDPAPPAPPPPRAPEPPAPAPEPGPTQAPDASPRRARPIAFLGASAARALVPGVAPGAVVGGGIVWSALRIDLAAELVPSARASLARVPGVGADFSLASLALRACAGRTLASVALHGCTALRGARIAGEGTGLTESYRQTAHLLAIEPGVLARFPAATRVGVELAAAAVLPITRPDFVFLASGPSEPLFRVSAVGARVGLGASVLF